MENPRDEETWWAAVYGVTQSLTRLKQLSSRWDSAKAVLRENFIVINACIKKLEGLCW